MPSDRRRLLLRVLLTAGIAILALELMRTGIADFLRLEPSHYLDRVQASGRRPDPSKLSAARDQLMFAKKIDPGNPIIREYLGIIYFHRAIIFPDDLPLRILYFETARNHYQDALTLRPNSGYLWAGMLAIRGELLDSRQTSPAYAGDSGNDLNGLQQALRHATRLAPWDASVLNFVVTTGKAHYKMLGPEERKLVDAAVKRAEKLK